MSHPEEWFLISRRGHSSPQIPIIDTQIKYPFVFNPMSLAAVQFAKRPFHVMAKAIGPKCNLDCQYCFYLEKEALFAKSERYRMPDELLERYIANYIESQPTELVSFAWQGGEPTLLGVPYFQKIVELQQKHAQGKRIENALQTNGTLLNDRWAEFLAANAFLVGVSIDGPEDLHNAYRIKRNGTGSFQDVLRGIRVLQKHGVEWNSLTCVNAVNSKQPLKVYKFLKGIGSRHMQFIPIVERRPNAAAQALGLDLSTPPDLENGDADPDMMPWSVQARDYGNFLNAIFDTWVRKDVGKVFVQLFEVSFAKWIGSPGGLCIFAETCGDAVALEHDGSIYSCDHYVYPEFKLGNVADSPLSEMLNSDQQRKFGRDKFETLPRKCLECAYRPACNGGCPKHRSITTKDGEPGLNYLCDAYYRFFKHADPFFQTMGDLYRQRQSPANIMTLLKKRKS